MKSSQRHVDQVMRVAAQCAPAVKPGDNDNTIRRSWHRCVNEFMLDPANKRSPQIETSTRLSEMREQMEPFRRIARAGIEQLYRNAPYIGYVLITNADGIIIDYLGNNSWNTSVESAGLLPGANWQEGIAGTNGIGTCIFERAPLTCHGDAHFYATHLGLSCDSAPLFDATGNFMGVINVSSMPSPEAPGGGTSPYLTMLYSQMIEGAMFLRHFRDRWVVRLGSAWELLDVCTDSMLALDADGVIVGATSGARRQLRAHGPDARNASGDGLVGKHLAEVFKCSPADVWMLMRPGSSSERHVVVSPDNQRLCASVIQPITQGTATTSSSSNKNADSVPLNRLAGDDKHMRRLLDQARRLVDRHVSIFVQGETGTGKEVLARALHAASNRAGHPFVAVNCAALPESLIESELFGYTAGTFTGARSKGKKGLIQQSDGGTLFLDEIGDMPLHLQTRLLRVLSEREVLPLGADKAVPVELTVISASHRDLRKLILQGLFREDLFYRLCGATLFLPPLRHREDRAHLINRVLEQEAQQADVRAQLSDSAMAMLMAYPWPGNVRELRNALRFALAVAEDHQILPEHLPPEVANPSASLGSCGTGAIVDAPHLWETHSPHADETVESPGDTAAQLRVSLRKNRWNITAVASELGLCRSSVYRQMRRFGIVPPTHY